MGLIKSFKCIILYMRSLLSLGRHFFFSLTGAGSSLLLMLMEITHAFLLATGPQKVTQILLPSSQVGNGFVQNNRVQVSESASV